MATWQISADLCKDDVDQTFSHSKYTSLEEEMLKDNREYLRKIEMG